MDDGEEMRTKKKFHIPKPSRERLDSLGRLVDQIEEMRQQNQPFQATLDRLNQNLTVPTTTEEILAYPGSRTRDEFLAAHLIPDPYQHQNVTEDELIWLIEQILEHPDDVRLSYYAKILEINTSAPEGTVADLVFYRDLRQARDILGELRRCEEKVIRL